MSARNKSFLAIDALFDGEIVAVPTETVYGLAVRADNYAAIKRLLELKERPIGGDKCLTMMVSNVREIEKYARLDSRTKNLAIRHFPGELTMILPKNHDFQHDYFDNFSKIGIRIPDYPLLLEIIEATGPLLVTSANPKGEAPCRNLQEIARRMPEVKFGLAGKCGNNLPSTIIDFTSMRPEVVRQGGLLIIHYR